MPGSRQLPRLDQTTDLEKRIQIRHGAPCNRRERKLSVARGNELSDHWGKSRNEQRGQFCSDIAERGVKLIDLLGSSLQQGH